MYHYNPEPALEELNEDAALPHPVHIRDMIVRAELSPDRAIDLTRKLHTYLHNFGEAHAAAKRKLEELVKP